MNLECHRNCDYAENTFGDEQFNFPLGSTQKLKQNPEGVNPS